MSNQLPTITVAELLALRATAVAANDQRMITMCDISLQPAAQTRSTPPRRRSKEWNRMWACLAAFTGGDTEQVNGFDAWQYMGTADGQHEFRHRSHPTLGRTIWRTPAKGGN